MTDKEQIEEFADQLILELIQEYDRLGLRASGNYAEKLQKQVSKSSEGFRLIISAPRYAGAMEEGRKPTGAGGKSTSGSTLREAILNWIQVKGIRPAEPKMKLETLAFLIARKIHREGIKVPNPYNQGGVISNILTQDKIFDFVKKIQFLKVEEVKSEIISLFKTAV